MKTPTKCPVCGAGGIYPVHAQGLQYRAPEDTACGFDPSAFRCQRGHTFICTEAGAPETGEPPADE